MNNTIKQARNLGQGIWLDYIQRSMISTGELKRLIEEVGISGLTSNPTIFEKAINGSNDYNEEIARLQGDGFSAHDIYEKIAFEDISDAADLMASTFDETQGTDGFVSIELSPHFAYDSEVTIAEVERLHKTIDRRNLMVKVPGTLPGIEAIRESIARGHNINATLLFSISGYEAVAKAYIDGLKMFRASGGDISKVSSVASFFLSRIDTKVDKEIDALMSACDGQCERVRLLRGKAAIAVAKIVYQRFLKIFSGPEWEELAAAGARVQRPLWASTGTKDPSYSDIKYVEQLIGPNTVNTLPMSTIEAFLGHGQPRLTVIEDYKEAVDVLTELKAVEIDIDRITDKLQSEGAQLFIDSFDQLIDAIEENTASTV